MHKRRAQTWYRNSVAHNQKTYYDNDSSKQIHYHAGKVYTSDNLSTKTHSYYVEIDMYVY